MTVPLIHQILLQLAGARDLQSFEKGLKAVMDAFDLHAWACFFPPSFEAGGRPILVAHGTNPQADLRWLVDKWELIERDGSEAAVVLKKVAGDLSPDRRGDSRILRLTRSNQSAFTMFLFRSAASGAFANEDLALIGEAGRHIDRCFLALANQQEQEFLVGVLRIVANLHSEGLCILDSRQRIVFQNRPFREHMLLWENGPDGLRNLSLPRQVELPPAWLKACQECFGLFKQAEVTTTTRLAVSQGPLVNLQVRLTAGEQLAGAVRYVAFRSSFGVIPYLLLTSQIQQMERNGGASLKQIAAEFGFSPRETDVSKLILEGCSAAEISKRLRIALPTVKTHIRHVLQKSGAKTRLQFVGLCLK